MKTQSTHARAFADPIRVVTEFHRVGGYPIRDEPPAELPIKEARLRKNLCNEEAREVAAAVEAGDIVAIGKELTDLEYVVAGTAVQVGLSPENGVVPAVRWLLDMISARMQSGLENDDPARAEMAAAASMIVIRGLCDLYCLPLAAMRDAVHASNMTKFEGKVEHRQSDGKLLKGPSYRPADIRRVLEGYERTDEFVMHDRVVTTSGGPFTVPMTRVLPLPKAAE